jgi:hypothetical protein
MSDEDLTDRLVILPLFQPPQVAIVGNLGYHTAIRGRIFFLGESREKKPYDSKQET